MRGFVFLSSDLRGLATGNPHTSLILYDTVVKQTTQHNSFKNIYMVRMVKFSFFRTSIIVISVLRKTADSKELKVCDP